MSSRDNRRMPRTNEYFVPIDGINREVITTDICRYLGNDALVRPGSYEEMISDLQADSERWEAERTATRGGPDGLPMRGANGLVGRSNTPPAVYRASTTHQSRQYYGPTETTPRSVYPNATQKEAYQEYSSWQPPSGYGAQPQENYCYGAGMTAVAPGDANYRTTSPNIFGQYSDNYEVTQTSTPRSSLPQRSLEPPRPYKHMDPYVGNESFSSATEGGSVVQDSNSSMKTSAIQPLLLPSQRVTMPVPARRQHIKRHKKTLPIILNEQAFEACADSGATRNMMSTAQAEALKCKTVEHQTPIAFELPLTGKHVESVGRAYTVCSFPGEQDTKQSCEFFLFDNLISPIIIGRKFLRDTNTFDRFKHRLKDVPITGPITLPLVRWFGTIQERLPCYLDSTLVHSSPDTGSEVNVISSTTAKEITPWVDRTVAGQVQFANGEIQKTLGRIRAKVTFGKNPEYFIEAKFEVIENLRVDVILGDDLLYEADIYTKHANLFDFSMVDSANLDLGTIAWLGIGEKIIQRAGTRISTILKKGDTSDLEATANGTQTGMKSIDDSDLVEEERHQHEQARIEKLRGDQQLEAKAREDRAHAEYLAQRVRFMFGSPPP